MERRKIKFSIKDILKQSIIGFLAGVISGLFSTGGGMILVPAFIYLLKLDNTKARGTSVFCILPMVVTSGIFYYKENYIEWKIAILCAIGLPRRPIYPFLVICSISLKVAISEAIESLSSESKLTVVSPNKNSHVK